MTRARDKARQLGEMLTGGPKKEKHTRKKWVIRGVGWGIDGSPPVMYLRPEGRELDETAQEIEVEMRLPVAMYLIKELSDIHLQTTVTNLIKALETRC